jgi:hypothetical protein
MNPGYSCFYAPVQRNSLLFHHDTRPSRHVYIPAQPKRVQSYNNLYFPYTTSTKRSQAPYPLLTPIPYNNQAYPNNSVMTKTMVPSLIPFTSYSIPTVTYPSIVSSNSLAIILIATLMLVALDLMFVRPQKSRTKVQSSISKNLRIVHF